MDVPKFFAVPSGRVLRERRHCSVSDLLR